jgi:hypothetical protein
MEVIIITVAILALAGYWIYTMSQPDQKDNEANSERPWPYGKALPAGKIHVKPADVAPGKSADDRVESTAPQCGCGRSPTGFCVGLHKLTAEEWAVSDQNPNRVSAAEVTAQNKQKAVAKAKKAPVKKTAAKPAVAKKAPAKKKSV